MKAGLLLIATGKYDRFLNPLIESADRHFFKGEPIDIYIFSDKKYEREYFKKPLPRINIQVMEIKHYPFPYATLYRYKHFDQYKDVLTSDYLFYLDVDMLFVNDVGHEILGDLVCVRHPGFYRGGWGSSGCDPKSLAYLPENLCTDYKAGGFQGGRRDVYLGACDILNQRIAMDELKGVMAQWHDETHWNWYLKTIAKNVKTLSPSYCYPQAVWAKGMPFQKKIIALEKNHAEIRK